MTKRSTIAVYEDTKELFDELKERKNTSQEALLRELIKTYEQHEEK